LRLWKIQLGESHTYYKLRGEMKMPSLNRIVLVGRLTRDPELRSTASGTAVANFTLAVDRQRSNAQGERQADFIRIVVWGKQAETCTSYLSKGRLVAVDGRLQISAYQGQDGQNRTSAEVVAESVRFLSPRPANGSAPAVGASSLDAEVPGETYSEFDNGFGSEEPPF
jgi:single-strand DNA-binding protein